jgi:hypothetical protein
MKTPMQELIKMLEKDVNSGLFNKDEQFGYNVAIDIAKSLVNKERNHLVNAYDWGLVDGEKDEKKGYYDGDTYYNDYYIESEKILKTQSI